MQIDYKSSPNRLFKYFDESRNNWRQRSLIYQKEKSELLIKNRDLERSKEKWKNECIQLRTVLKDIKKKNEIIKEFAKKILEC
jgi:hypothetical protein